VWEIKRFLASIGPTEQIVQYKGREVKRKHAMLYLEELLHQLLPSYRGIRPGRKMVIMIQYFKFVYERSAAFQRADKANKKPLMLEYNLSTKTSRIHWQIIFSLLVCFPCPEYTDCMAVNSIIGRLRQTRHMGRENMMIQCKNNIL
jgi:hypothetical protein